MRTTETIQLYTLEEAEKVISYRRKRAHRRKMRELKQKLVFKGVSLACVIAGIAVASIVEFDNGGAVVVALMGLVGLFVPFNAVITW